MHHARIRRQPARVLLLAVLGPAAMTWQRNRSSDKEEGLEALKSTKTNNNVAVARWFA